MQFPFLILATESKPGKGAPRALEQQRCLHRPSLHRCVKSNSEHRGVHRSATSAHLDHSHWVGGKPTQSTPTHEPQRTNFCVTHTPSCPRLSRKGRVRVLPNNPLSTQLDAPLHAPAPLTLTICPSDGAPSVSRRMIALNGFCRRICLSAARPTSSALRDQSFLNPPSLVEHWEGFDRTSDISLRIPRREGEKRARGMRSVVVTPHLTRLRRARPPPVPAKVGSLTRG
jgi:hypothetical protein